MKKLLTLIVVFISSHLFGQDFTASEYESSVGVKIATGVAFSFKKFVTPTNALEAQAMAFNQGVRFVAMYQFHFYNIEGLNGLAWYAGPGVHVGFWKAKYKAEYNASTDLGVDGVVGLDYKIPGIPINVSIDWQPSFGLIGNSGIQPQFGGLGLRYVLK